MSKPARLLSRPVHPVTGKRLTVRARNRRELEARLHALDSMRQDLRLGIRTEGETTTALRGLERKRVTLLEAADSYAALTRLAPRTRDGARLIVRDSGSVYRGRATHGPLFELAQERLEALTAPRVAKHFRKLAEVHAWSYVKDTWRKLRAIIRHAAEQGWITAAPWGMWRPAAPTHPKAGRPRRECARSALEREALYHAAFANGTRLAAVIAVGTFAGPRKGEIAGLKWGDVDFGRAEDGWFCTVTLRRQGDGRPLKRGESRVIVADALGSALEAWRACAQLEEPARAVAPSAPIFPNASGGHVRSGVVIDVDKLRTAAARAGLGDPKRWSLHSLRDSFVTIEAQACGGDLRRLAERTGHRSIDSLLRYLQTFERNPRPPSTTTPALPAPRP